jgi:hypothetical protein
VDQHLLDEEPEALAIVGPSINHASRGIAFGVAVIAKDRKLGEPINAAARLLHTRRRPQIASAFLALSHPRGEAFGRSLSDW